MSASMHFFEALHDAPIRELLDAWKSEYPNMGLLALVAEADREPSVPALQELFSRANVPAAGAVFPALLSNDRFYQNGCLLLRFNVMPYVALYDLPGPSSPSDVIRKIAQDISEKIEKPRDCALFLIFDQMVGNIATKLDELYLALSDRVRYLGVNAGSETFRPMPCLFDNSRIIQNGVIVTLLPHHPGAVVEHCYAAPERMISATSTEGSRIITIDWRPAFEVYQEAVRAEYGVQINAENFYQYGVHFPFGIVRANGEIVVRIPVALQEDGSLFCVGEVPPNAVLTLLRAPEVDSSQTVQLLVQGLQNLHGPLPGAEILTFYCAGRRLHLGERAREELADLGKRTGAAQIAGALSLGEIGHSMQWGYPLFHNGALLSCRWG
jgi:hypothetical protein